MYLGNIQREVWSFFPVQWHNKIQKDEPLLKDGLEECTVYKKFYLSA